MSEVYARPEPSLIPIPRPYVRRARRRMTLTRIGSGLRRSRSANLRMHQLRSRLQSTN